MYVYIYIYIMYIYIYIYIYRYSTGLLLIEHLDRASVAAVDALLVLDHPILAEFPPALVGPTPSNLCPSSRRIA